MKAKEEDIKRVAVLIGRWLTGAIDEHEREWLQKWRGQSEANEQLFARLTNPQQLAQEYRKIKMVKTERPLEDMKKRIADGTSRPKKISGRRMWAVAVAAALLAGLLWNGAVRFHRSSEATLVPTLADIHPGQTQATLILSTGENIDLMSDTLVGGEGLGKKSVAAVAPDMSVAGQKEEQKTNMLITPRGGEFKIVLEDGTEVWLNAESQLVYPETFGETERRVAVQGEAYFKVAKEDGKPFYIETHGQQIRVYGTEFNVRSYEEDESVYTTLVEGSIAIQPIGAAQGELILTPNSQALFNKKDATTHLRTVNTEVVISWKNGMFVFEEQTLEQIMCTLSRWYNFTYRFEDEDLKKTVFMGSIPRYAEFDDVIHILEKSGGIRLEMKGTTVLLSGK